MIPRGAPGHPGRRSVSSARRFMCIVSLHRLSKDLDDARSLALTRTCREAVTTRGCYDCRGHGCVVVVIVVVVVPAGADLLRL